MLPRGCLASAVEGSQKPKRMAAVKKRIECFMTVCARSQQRRPHGGTALWHDAGERLLFLLFTVRTGAGVFLVLAGRAVVEVQIELLGHCLGTFLLADLHHGGEVVAFGNCLV